MRKTNIGWISFSGSYCSSTQPEKPLTKSDTVYSWIPNYFHGDEYKITQPGIYKYKVPMGLEKNSDEPPVDLINNQKTRARTRTFFEIETEFKVE